MKRSKHQEQYSELLGSEEQKKQVKQSTIVVFGLCSGTSSRPYLALKGKKISKNLAEMIAFDMLPYSFVQWQGFQRLIGSTWIDGPTVLRMREPIQRHLMRWAWSRDKKVGQNDSQSHASTAKTNSTNLRRWASWILVQLFSATLMTR